MVKQKTISWEQKYTKIKKLGEGGNGEVILVSNIKTKKEYALKYLYKITSEKKVRFQTEIKLLTNTCKGIVGIIPVVDHSSNELWYVMEVATPIFKYINLNKLSLKDIVIGMIQLCETLEVLHSRGISHRDIKPDNILYYNNRFCFGDFGLAFDPSIITPITKNGRDLGAHFTIAPEMKRYPKEADGCKADIYSLAKTFWMLLTNDEMGFDGQYNFFSDKYKLRNYSSLKESHIALLEDLIYQSTDENPDKRPTATEFKERLIRWINEEDNYFLAEETEWKFLEKRMFPNGIIPERSKWTNIIDIIRILNIFRFVKTTEHVFLPDGGGLNYKKAMFANEQGCIYLIVEGNYNLLLSPKCLYYETFKDKKWNYFILELNTLNPILEQTDIKNSYCEELCEDLPAHYVDAKDFGYGVYSYEEGIPLPEKAKKVERYFRGRFLSVFSNGYYNSINATYDARHSDAPTCDIFRNYIHNLSEKTNYLNFRFIKSANRNKIIEKFLNIKESQNPFVPKEKEKRIKKSNPIKNKIITKLLFKMKYFFYVKNRNKTNASFYITFEKSITHINFSDFKSLNESSELFYITKNGKLSSNPEKKLILDNRENIIDIYNKVQRLKKYICKICGNENFIDWNFHIKIFLTNKLTNLFSLEEIKDAMSKTDDRKTQWLVIDEKGIPQFVTKHEYVKSYPFYCNEPFIARNRYLGKYSDLILADECYHDLLIKYLLFLRNESNKYKYIDLDDTEIIKKINEVV